MHDRVSSHSEQISPSKAKVVRARSVPTAKPYYMAVFFSSIHYLALIATATAVGCVLVRPNEAAVHIMVGGLVFSAISWLVAFFKRRATCCPLCKGTPLVNSGARVHARARRLFPFNHGVTAILSIMATQKFRCMYCGSDYDLLKPRTRLLHGDGEYRESNDSSDQDKWS